MIITLIINKLGGYNKIRQRYVDAKSKYIKSFYLLLNRGLEMETNSYLPFENEIAGPVNFPHGVCGIFISGGAVIGDNCTIYQQVTIGSNMLIDSYGFGHPTIGDNCFIGAGAKIIGNIKIGNNCRIGANVVVTKDVPNDCLVVSSHQRIINKGNLNNRVYQIGNNEEWGYIDKGQFVKEENELILETIRLKLSKDK